MNAGPRPGGVRGQAHEPHLRQRAGCSRPAPPPPPDVNTERPATSRATLHCIPYDADVKRPEGRSRGLRSSPVRTSGLTRRPAHRVFLVSAAARNCGGLEHRQCISSFLRPQGGDGGRP